ncbi:helix-turn-helix transcriptional regulator [Paenibacillus sp. 11B]|nr:helix-turn-helix transcriptional regulator [Paenibacillus sp. 11B]MDN8587981.1 helix-turn-helix transcriptional regulator [Paenibacillus sp. 11B]
MESKLKLNHASNTKRSLSCCSQRIYSNYERGELDIPTALLIKLADYHQTSTDYLLNRTDVRRPYPSK